MTENVERYPRIRKLLTGIGWSLLIGLALGFYGRWQYHRGFDRGADAAICAFAVGMDGQTALTKYDACRNVSSRNYTVDGFDSSGRTLATQGDRK